MSALEGFLLGYSNFIFPAYMAYLFIIMSLLTEKWAKEHNDWKHDVEFEKILNNMMLSAFMLIGAGSESGTAAAMAGDAELGAKAGIIIFKHAVTKSKIDVLNIPKEAKEIDMNTFKGEIIFKDVWFRYPTRKTEWVFRNMNVTIPAG